LKKISDIFMVAFYYMSHESKIACGASMGYYGW